MKPGRPLSGELAFILPTDTCPQAERSVCFYFPNSIHRSVKTINDIYTIGFIYQKAAIDRLLIIYTDQYYYINRL